jgi:hypothetical protein
MTINSTFPLTFNVIKRDPDEREIDNILERDVGEYKQSSIAELAAKVDTGNNIDFISAQERFKNLKTVFDPADMPIAKQIVLGVLMSDEDIQREIDVPHATHIFSYYDPQRVQSIQVIKAVGKEKYTIVNGQHTATTTALIIMSGLMKGWKAKDWKLFPVNVTYIETDDRSKARETFALMNGEMSKEITTFDHWKQHYLSVRLDGSGNPKYVHTYDLIQLLRKYNCTPLPEGHDDIGQAGAVTHLNAVETAAKNENYERLEFILKNHDTYWNSLPVDNSEFGLYGSLLDITEDENISHATKEWDTFMTDLHAVIQKVFKGMTKLRSSAKKAYKKYRYDLFADKNASSPFTVELYVAYKVYRLLGGTFNIPKLHTMYLHKNIDVINYLTETEVNHINSLVTSKIKLKVKDVVIPAANKKR